MPKCSQRLVHIMPKYVNTALPKFFQSVMFVGIVVTGSAKVVRRYKNDHQGTLFDDFKGIRFRDCRVAR